MRTVTGYHIDNYVYLSTLTRRVKKIQRFILLCDTGKSGVNSDTFRNVIWLELTVDCDVAVDNASTVGDWCTLDDERELERLKKLALV